MVDIKDIVDEAKNELLDSIHEFEILDDFAPFKKEDFVVIKGIVNNLHQSSAQTMDSLTSQIISLKNQKDTLLDIYDENTKELLLSLDERMAIIKRKYEESINGLKEEVELSRKKNEKNKETVLQDIEFYISSSLQKVEVCIQDYNDSVKRFNYQYSIAKESYGNNIIYYNNQLEQELNKLNEAHEVAIKEFSNETDILVESYNNLIKEQTTRLDGINKEYKEKLSNLKLQKRNETENLNNKIRSLGSVKDNRIESIKTEYTNATAKLNQNRDKDNQDNTNKNQNIIKDFVYNMDELDGILQEQKAKFIITRDTEHEGYFENQLLIHRTHENELKELLASNPIKPKQAIRRINKEYLDIELENEKNHKAIIDRLEKEFSIASESNAYQKKRLDIVRTYSIKNLSFEEIKNNKLYQEKNNSLENEMSFEIFLTNHRYNVDANNKRLESNYNMLSIERQISALDADHQKNVRRVNNVIRANKLEIEYAREANKITTDFQQKRYDRTINYLTVSNLLEIEKCKVLNNFNSKSFDLNILNAKVTLNYSKDKFDLDNEQNKAIKTHALKIDDKTLEALVNTTAYRIKELTFNEEKEYALEKQNKSYSIDVLSHNVLVNRFKLNIKSLNQALSAFILLIKRLEDNIENVISYILDKILIDDYSFPLVESFISKLAKVALNYHIKLIELYERISVGIIDNHLDFEADFKFKTVLIQLKEKYVQDDHYIQGEIDRLTKDIKEAEDKIENITSRISRLELTNSYDRQKYRAKSVIKKNKQTIKRLFKLVKKTELENEKARVKIKFLKSRLTNIQKNYANDINKIKRLQYNSAQAYHILRSSIMDTTKAMLTELNNYDLKEASQHNTRASYIELISKAKNDFISFNIVEIKKLYIVINTFNISNAHNLTASLNQINAENVASIKKLKEATLNKINSAKELFSKNDEAIRLDIDTLKREGQQILRDYQRRQRQTNRNYEESSNNILESRLDSRATFFTELYAITDNSADIKESYIEDIKELNKEYNAKRDDILRKTLEAKNDFNEKLNKYIKTRNLIIKNLPLDFKEKKAQLTEENREKNNEIEMEINQMKSNLYQKRKDSKRNVNSIEGTFQTNLAETSIEKKKLLNKEKRKYSALIRRLR